MTHATTIHISQGNVHDIVRDAGLDCTLDEFETAFTAAADKLDIEIVWLNEDEAHWPADDAAEIAACDLVEARAIAATWSSPEACLTRALKAFAETAAESDGSDTIFVIDRHGRLATTVDDEFASAWFDVDGNLEGFTTDPETGEDCMITVPINEEDPTVVSKWDALTGDNRSWNQPMTYPTSHDALGPTGPLHTANRLRSYANRVARGDRVVFEAPNATMTSRFDDVVGDRIDAGRLEVGRRYEGVVLSESNAGFRGIEMMVELADGRWVSGVSTGAIVIEEVG